MKHMQTETKTEIRPWKTLPSAMRSQGYKKLGTTNDFISLPEIERDYASKGIKVVFTRGALDDVHYWTKA